MNMHIFYEYIWKAVYRSAIIDIMHNTMDLTSELCCSHQHGSTLRPSAPLQQSIEVHYSLQGFNFNDHAVNSLTNKWLLPQQPDTVVASILLLVFLDQEKIFSAIHTAANLALQNRSVATPRQQRVQLHVLSTVEINYYLSTTEREISTHSYQALKSFLWFGATKATDSIHLSPFLQLQSKKLTLYDHQMETVHYIVRHCTKCT